MSLDIRLTWDLYKRSRAEALKAPKMWLSDCPLGDQAPQPRCTPVVGTAAVHTLCVGVSVCASGLPERPAAEPRGRRTGAVFLS